MSYEFSKKIKDNNNKLFKKTSYDIRAYVGEPGNFFGDDAVFTPEAAETVVVLQAKQRTILGVVGIGFQEIFVCQRKVAIAIQLVRKGQTA